MDEKELVRRSQKDDEEAFATLVNQYKRKVFHLAYSLTHDEHAADDLAQEVFIKVYFALKKFKGESEFGTWIYRIAVNHCRDYLRKKSRMRLLSLEDIKEPGLSKDHESALEEKESEEEQRREAVHDHIRKLPEKYRIILSLRDIQGFSYEEIGSILGLSPGTVDSRLHRARMLLRKKMEPFFSKGGEDHVMQ